MNQSSSSINSPTGSHSTRLIQTPGTNILASHPGELSGRDFQVIISGTLYFISFLLGVIVAQAIVQGSASQLSGSQTLLLGVLAVVLALFGLAFQIIVHATDIANTIRNNR